MKQLFTSKLAIMTILVWLTYFFTFFVGTFLTWLPTLLHKAGFSLVRSYGTRGEQFCRNPRQHLPRNGGGPLREEVGSRLGLHQW